MRYSILFIIVVVLVSGFIAYFGDILGRRMGKKRLTLFNMRPKYTAIVATTITGMIIAASVIALLLSIDTNFRRIFAEGDQIIETNTRLTNTNSRLERRISYLSKRSAEMEKEVVKRKEEVVKALVEAAKATQARDAALKNVQRLEQNISRRKVQLAELQRRSDAAVREAREMDARLVDSTERLVNARLNLTKTQKDLRFALADLTIRKKQLEDTKTQLAQDQQTLKQQQAALKEQEDMLRAQHAALVKLDEERGIYQTQSSRLRSKELIIRQGEEIARATISCKQSSFGIKGDILSLLGDASDKAKLLGAAVGTNERAVTVVYPLDNDIITAYNEEVCIRMAVNSITSSYQDALIQVVSARNTIRGEQALVEFRLYHNDLVYSKGRLIATSKIDGRPSEGRILLSVINFLQTEVSQAALRAGIIPVANPDPRASLGRDPGSQVEGLMAVVERIKTFNARVKLEVYSCEDVYAAGPLNMDNMRFSVTKIE